MSKVKNPKKKKSLKKSKRTLKGNLYAFTRKSFTTTNPGTKYLHNWHIELISEYLEACTRGEIKRLIINMPPRAMKSLSVSVAWPAWLLGQDPSRRIIVSSYAQNLSLKHSADCRLVMNSRWYKNIFPQVKFAHGQNEKAKFVTTKRGFRFATSTDGSVTGEGGNYLIVDDPTNPTHIHSKLVRQHTIDWFEQTFSSRADDKKNCVFVIVMQRLHEDDLSGHLLKSGMWEHLNIPAIAEQKTIIEFGDFRKIREEGDILHESREGREELENAKLQLGSYAFSAQYQQKPVPLKGGIVKRQWLKHYKYAPANPLHIVQSWDTAIASARDSDYSVCTTWSENGNGYYLLDVFRAQLEYPELKHALINLAEKFSPHTILIENKASGQSLIQDIKRETRLPVLAITPSKDKFTRMASVSPLFESGKVFFPEVARWLQDYEMEILNFPSVAHDDQSDSTSQFLNWAKGKRSGEARVRSV